MKTQMLDRVMTYDGAQLRSLFAYETLGIMGDSIVAWVGPCQVDFGHMVDMEDLRVRSVIAGSSMVHFIVEKFDCQLLGAVALQRLLASIVRDVMLAQWKSAQRSDGAILREGDDLYWNGGKLSISIATVSPVSALIHFAVNISNAGTPVKTSSLEDLEIEPKTFAHEVMVRFSTEVATIIQATQKVRWVR